MPTPALYDTLHSFKDIHKVILKRADGVNDKQIKWKPEGTSNRFWFGNGATVNVIARRVLFSTKQSPTSRGIASSG